MYLCTPFREKNQTRTALIESVSEKSKKTTLHNKIYSCLIITGVSAEGSMQQEFYLQISWKQFFGCAEQHSLNSLPKEEDESKKEEFRVLSGLGVYLAQFICIYIYLTHSINLLLLFCKQN